MLCKSLHNKGKVERLIRFVKDNFLAREGFHNISELNEAAIEWSDAQNLKYHREIDDIPGILHTAKCTRNVHVVEESLEIMKYLCPERTISFDGFVGYEGRRFGVPYSYTRKTSRVHRKGEKLMIYSDDLQQLLVSYDITWSRCDRYCEGQFPELQPQEQPTMPVTTYISRLESPKGPTGFEKFNFDEEDDLYE